MKYNIKTTDTFGKTLYDIVLSNKDLTKKENLYIFN